MYLARGGGAKKKKKMAGSLPGVARFFFCAPPPGLGRARKFKGKKAKGKEGTSRSFKK